MGTSHSTLTAARLAGASRTKADRKSCSESVAIRRIESSVSGISEARNDIGVCV